MTILNTVLQSLRTSPVGSTAVFNAAYEKAEAKLAFEKRQGTEFKQRSLYTLFDSLRSGYRTASAKILADGLFQAKDDVPSLIKVLKELEQWHSFVNAAFIKCGYRLGLTDVEDLALFNLRQADTWRHVEDIGTLAQVLLDPTDRAQILVYNSGLYAEDLMSNVLSVSQDNDLAWEMLLDDVRKMSQTRFGKGRATKTDAILAGNEVLVPFMVPHVLNRFLSRLLKVQGRHEYQLEQAETRRARAISEITGKSAEFRTRKIGGYANLSGSDSKGYCSPGEEERVDTDAMQGDEDKDVLGLDTLLDISEGFKLIEVEILQTIKATGRAMEAAGQEATPAVYLYTPEGDAVTNRDYAVKLNEDSLQSWLAERRVKFTAQREDDARYTALQVKVPTFNL